MLEKINDKLWIESLEYLLCQLKPGDHTFFFDDQF
jgi:hypothetical protein